MLAATPLLVALLTPPPPTAAAPEVELPRVLVFTRTAGFRHESIPDGIAAVRELGAARWTVDATEDPSAFTPGNLARYRTVVFLSTTGDVLGDDQERAFEGFIRAGGGFAGIHAATDTEYGWPWFGTLVGARFATHPPVQPAVVRVEDRSHPSTAMLPPEWRRTDEWYAFRSNPRGAVRVLATLDERTYEPGAAAMGADHPIAWCHEFDGGRSWYTAGGHTKESFAEPAFRAHVAAGIAWAGRLEPIDVERIAPPASGGAGASAPKDEPIAPAEQPGGTGVILAGPAILAAGELAALGSWVAVFSPVVALALIAAVGRNGIRPSALAFIFPGLGHLATGHRRRGLVAMAAVCGMFACGLLVGGVDAVDRREDTPWFAAQAFNGPMAYAADWANQSLLKTGKLGELVPTPPSDDGFGRTAPGNPTVSTFRGLGAANEFGTLFIALGGLMNLVLALDVARREPA